MGLGLELNTGPKANSEFSVLDAQECRALYSFISKRTKNVDLCQEIFQETYKRLLEASQSRDIARPLFYAYTVSRRLIGHHFSRTELTSGEIIEEISDEEPLADRVLLDRERLQLFEDAISKLPKLRREVFLRRRVLGESSKVVAEYFDIGVNAVDKHVSRALISIHDEMAKATRRLELLRGPDSS